MPYDPIQGQGQGGQKVVKMTDFKVNAKTNTTVQSNC